MTYTTPILSVLLLDTYDTISFGLADISQYPAGFTITNPTIEITPPGFPKVALVWTPRSANIFKASDLGLGACVTTPCIAIPDGIYTITYSVYPATTYSVTKTFLRTTNIVCKLQKTFLTIEQECHCPAEYRKIAKYNINIAKMLIEGAISAANNGDQVQSFDLYRKADQFIDLINRCNHKCDHKLLTNLI